MGIKNLNNFIATECNNNAIQKTHLSDFAGKTIVIDTSIYLYRFLGENKLMEQMYLMISILRHYNIIPIFVFDGKPPNEKKEVLQERREKKQKAEQKHNELVNMLNQLEPGAEDRLELESEIMQLKKKFVRIKDSDNKRVQKLLDLYGVSWIEAQGEADVLCAQFMYKKKAYACMSEDMDMFAYGCHRVLRHFSLAGHTVLLYDLHAILQHLDINAIDFRKILVLSGTDYNKHESTNLYESIKLFKKYKKATMMCMDIVPDFYEWLLANTKYIKDYANLLKTYEMFNIINYTQTNEIVDAYIPQNKDIQWDEIANIMEEDGFIFEPNKRI